MRRPHSCQILVVKQADEMGIEINFVDAIRDLFQSHQFAYKARPIKRSRPRHLMCPRLRTLLVSHARG